MNQNYNIISYFYTVFTNLVRILNNFEEIRDLKIQHLNILMCNLNFYYSVQNIYLNTLLL